MSQRGRRIARAACADLTARPDLLPNRPAQHSCAAQAGHLGGIVTTERIATALRRLQSILRRRPAAAVAPDSAALSIWQGGGRVLTRPEHGTQILTDLPAALGGAGEHVTPGWRCARD